MGVSLQLERQLRHDPRQRLVHQLGTAQVHPLLGRLGERLVSLALLLATELPRRRDCKPPGSGLRVKG